MTDIFLVERLGNTQNVGEYGQKRETQIRKEEKLRTKRKGVTHGSQLQIWAKEADAVRDVAGSSRAHHSTIAPVKVKTVDPVHLS